MLARVYYLALADRMVEKGVLIGRDDIFYLYDSEIRAYIRGETAGDEIQNLPSQRKQEMERCKEAILPEVIFGDEIPLIIASCADKLSGTPTSKGYYMGLNLGLCKAFKTFRNLHKGMCW